MSWTKQDWRQGLRRLLRTERGVAAVELALIAPVIAIIILGVVDYGRVFTRTTTLANAAKAGTQFAMISRPQQGDLSAILTATQTALPDDFAGTTPDVQLRCECPPVGSGLQDCAAAEASCGVGTPSIYVQITIQETYATLFDYQFIPPTVDLTEQSIMRLR